MDKLQYIIKQLSKTNKKNYENYVVTRIWHKLDDLDFKMVTQQYVIRPEGKYAMTDMYFPQIGIHIEVDEEHHKLHISNDKVREHDIISITGHEIYRIDVSKNIENINEQIDTTVKLIKDRKIVLGSEFEKWDPSKEVSSETYIKKGYIDIKDDVAFEKSVDAINCFGYEYKGWQKGGINHPIEKDVLIWFPKLYSNGAWINSISTDESKIFERSAISHKVDEHISQVLNKGQHKRIIFARVIDSLGDIKYRFKGLYELNVQNTLLERQLVWERRNTRVLTYSPNRN